LAEDPALADLAESLRKLANSYQEATMDYLAEADALELQLPPHAGDEATLTLRELCK
jgi:hypothetical protein